MSRQLVPFNRDRFTQSGGKVEWQRGAGPVVIQNKDRKIQVLRVVVADGEGKPDHEKVMLASAGGPLVLLVDSKGRIGLIQKWQAQTRRPFNWLDNFPELDYKDLGRLSYELPGGMAAAGESLPDTARRELVEETGISVDASELKILGDFVSCPSQILNFDFYYIVKLSNKPNRRKSKKDEGIKGGIKFFTLKQITKLVAKGKLYDTRTMAAIFAYSLR